MIDTLKTIPNQLSFGTSTGNEDGERSRLTWVGGGWQGADKALELDIGLHQTESEDSLTLGAAWRISPLPSSSLSLEADADFADDPSGRLLLEGRFSF